MENIFAWRVTYICVHFTRAQTLPTSSQHVPVGMHFLGLGIRGLSHQRCMSLHIGTSNIVGGSMNLRTGCWTGGGTITPMVLRLEAGQGISAVTCGLGDVISSWWHWFRSLNSIYYHIHITYYRCILIKWNKLFLRDIYLPRVCVALTVYRMIRYCYCVLSCLVSIAYYCCVVQNSLYYNMDIGTIWHFAWASCTPIHFIGLVLAVHCSGVECHCVFRLLIHLYSAISWGYLRLLLGFLCPLYSF